MNVGDVDAVVASNMKNAVWQQDCGEKYDFDFSIVRVSCRSYGPGYNSNHKFSCYVKILMNAFAHDQDDYVEVAVDELFSDTQSALRVAVEEWVKNQITVIISTLFANMVIPKNDHNIAIMKKLHSLNQQEVV